MYKPPPGSTSLLETQTEDDQDFQDAGGASGERDLRAFNSSAIDAPHTEFTSPDTSFQPLRQYFDGLGKEGELTFKSFRRDGVLDKRSQQKPRDNSTNNPNDQINAERRLKVTAKKPSLSRTLGRTENATNSASSRTLLRRCPSCAWIMSGSISVCSRCQCSIPKIAEQEPRRQELRKYGNGHNDGHTRMTPPRRKKSREYRFKSDPRGMIPDELTPIAMDYMDDRRISNRERLMRYLNSITFHLRAGHAWICTKCGDRNKGDRCPKDGQYMYSLPLNELIRRPKTCVNCQAQLSPLEQEACPSCKATIDLDFDVRSYPLARWENSSEKSPKARSSDASEIDAEQQSANPRASSEQAFTKMNNWASFTPKLKAGEENVTESELGEKPQSKFHAEQRQGPNLPAHKVLTSSEESVHKAGEQETVHFEAGGKVQPRSQTGEKNRFVPRIRFTSAHHVIRRVTMNLDDDLDDNKQQENPSDNADQRAKDPRLGAHEDARRDDQQPYSVDDMDRMTRVRRPLIRRITGAEYFSVSQPPSFEIGKGDGSTNNLQSAEVPVLTAEQPSRLDRRRTALAQGLEGGKQPDRRRGFRKSRSEEMVDYDEDDFERQGRKRVKKVQGTGPSPAATEAPIPIYLPDFITVINLATALDINITKFTQVMVSLGFEDTSNDLVLDAETAGLIAAEFNFEATVDGQEQEQDLKAVKEDSDRSEMSARPPVVTIMGHVDHGKTTILDYLRKSSVAASEHGGITQHIGAFSVSMPSGRLITFLDTPGHKAFLDMRQRGANVTDIVILVVAADDSVKPQTIEAIKHAKGAGVQMIVAINKIDKEDADLDRVKSDLARNGVIIEEFGGDVQIIGVSGKTGEGMGDLEEATIALADTLELRAPTDGTVEGWILEATTTKAGRVATILVRRGTLTTGQTIVAGQTWTRVRTLRNEAGAEVPFAGPGTPVEVDGWRDQPTAGDEVLQANDESHARSVIDHRTEVSERRQMSEDVSAINESRRLEQEKRERDTVEAAGGQKSGILAPDDALPPAGPIEVPLLVKADVSGSVEAVLTSIPALGNTEVRPQRLRAGVGPVSESDVEHAATAKGHIVAFNIATEGAVRRLAEQRGVAIIEHTIIYRLLEEINKKLSDYLKPVVVTRVLGEAEVAQIFEITVKGRKTSGVAGCKVRNGVISRTAKCRVSRSGEVIYDGTFFQIILTLSKHSKHSRCMQNFPDLADFGFGFRYLRLPEEPKSRRDRDAQGERLRYRV